MASQKQFVGFTPKIARRLLVVAGGVNNSEFDERRPGRAIASESILVQTPSGGIAARSGTTCTEETCTEFKLVAGVLTSNTNTVDVYNIWPVAIPGSYYIVAKKEKRSGQWIAEFPGVLNVRWVDPKLEQTSNGSTYTTIDTAVDCA